MQALAATLKGTDHIKAFLATLSQQKNKEEGGGDGEDEGVYRDLTIPERIERARKRHFITGEEEIFACCNADIFAACYHGDLSGLVIHLNHIKTPIKGLRKRGETLLHAAVKGRKAHIIKFFLDERAENEIDIDAKNHMALTCMHLAALMNFAEIVTLLASYGAALSPKDRAGQTPAHYAAAAASLDALKAIHKCQPEPRTSAILSYQSTNGKTPAHLAALSGHHEVIRFLASVKVDLSIQDNMLENACHKAGRGGHLELMTSYMKKLPGADIEALNVEGDNPMHFANDNVRYG